MNLADIYSAIDSAKRRAVGLLDPDALKDMAIGAGRSIVTTPADIGQQFANFVQGNPGNVLGQPQGMDQIRGLLGSPTSDAQDVGEAIGPPMKLAGKALGLLSGKLPAMLAAHIAYHGSPYQFDKFDMSKIGTGEGAQAYGHGLYFAENPGVAKNYQRQLSGDNLGGDYLINGSEKVKGGTPRGMAASVVAGNPSPARMAENIKAYEDYAASMPDNTFAQDVVTHLKDLQGSSVKYTEPGNLYKVDINADPAHYLDWDSPLSEQSPHVQDALTNTYIPSWLGDMSSQTGEDLMTRMIHSTGGDQAQVSKELLGAGIPGIKYKDAGSRTGDGGTHNYVVFDDSLINNLGAAP